MAHSGQMPFRAGRSFVSAQQVAERAGVSRSAVSRTFTPGASVSEPTRRKVLEAAESLGYHVNHLARGLIHERSGIVCLIAADLQAPFQAKMLEALTRRLQDVDKVPMVINAAGPPGSVEAALRQTLNYRADASVVLSGSPAASLIDTCIANGQHVILINREDRHPGPEHLIVDASGPGNLAFDMLKRAGCRHIAIVSSQAGTSSLVGREQAFAAAARAGGIPVSLIRAGPTAYATGLEAARAMLSRADRPDGAFCVTDLLACGFMDAARHEFGLRIPDDFCIVGFDDIEQAGWASYELTTFRQPIERMADQIAHLLSSQAPVDPDPKPHYLQAEPVWRRSVRPK
jgi:DNA-binding LacI/PurR family transcriptional regulator